MSSGLCASVVCLWTSLFAVAAAAPDVHGEGTPVELGLFLAGVGATATLIWFARGERDEIRHRLSRIETLLKTRPCVLAQEHECPLPQEKETL